MRQGSLDGEKRTEGGERERERERETKRGKAVMKEVLIFYRGSLIRSCTDTSCWRIYTCVCVFACFCAGPSIFKYTSFHCRHFQFVSGFHVGCVFQCACLFVFFIYMSCVCVGGGQAVDR